MEFTFTAQKGSAAASIPNPTTDSSEHGQSTLGFGSGFVPGTQAGPGNPFQDQGQQQSTAQAFTFSPSNSGPFFAPVAAMSTPVQPPMTSWTSSAMSDDSNPYDRTALTRAHGVGSTRRWRERLITQIEDRIKNQRISLNNARRRGLFSGDFGQDPVQPSLSNPSNTQGALAPVAGQCEPQTNAGSEHVADASHSAAVPPQDTTNLVSTEADRRLVAEVWETFKRENYDSLVEAFQGMSDAEIESIEQDILQHQYSMQIDPSYEVVMELEQEEMEQTIEQYARLESIKSVEKQYNDPEIAAAISFSMSLLLHRPCIRCQQEETRLQLEDQPKIGCISCGFRVENDVLVYIATTARNHSQGCPGQLQIAYDEDTGLLIMCSQCELLA